MQCRQGPGLGQALEQARVAGQEGQGSCPGGVLKRRLLLREECQVPESLRAKVGSVPVLNSLWILC